MYLAECRCYASTKLNVSVSKNVLKFTFIVVFPELLFCLTSSIFHANELLFICSDISVAAASSSNVADHFSPYSFLITALFLRKLNAMTEFFCDHPLICEWLSHDCSLFTRFFTGVQYLMLCFWCLINTFSPKEIISRLLRVCQILRFCEILCI